MKILGKIFTKSITLTRSYLFSRKIGTNFAALLIEANTRGQKPTLKRMKQTQLFKRLTSATLAVLLLFLATAGRGVSSHKVVTKKPTTEKSNAQKTTDDEQPVVQEMSMEAVVAPAISFDFEQSFYFLPQVFIIEEFLSISTFKKFDEFYYFFSFFRNVFGHQIATNAP